MKHILFGIALPLFICACGGGGGGGGDASAAPPASSSSSSSNGGSSSSAGSSSSSSASSTSSSSSSGTVALTEQILSIPALIGGTTYRLEAKLYTPQDGKDMKRAAGVYGASNKRPVFWLYASNDNHSVATVTSWFNDFKAAGGTGSTFFTAPYYPSSGGNGHGVNSAPSYYLTELLAFFDGIGFK